MDGKLYRYSVTTDTDVSVTCLNTGDEWQFSTQAGTFTVLYRKTF